jgi:addiction module HigA family antidote
MLVTLAMLEEFLKPMGISQYRLAKEIGVSQRRIGPIVAGQRAITADTDFRLCKFFGLSDGWGQRRGVRSCLLPNRANHAATLSMYSVSGAISRSPGHTTVP